MRNIVLLCNMGMSTSLMVKRMCQAAEAQGYEIKCAAYPFADAAKYVYDADSVLVGPQIAFEVPNLEKKYAGVKFEAINMQDYGRMNGEKVLNRVKQVLGD